MLSLYIHIPFCRAKCRYCGFYSTPYESGVADLYLDALNKEFSRYKGKLQKTTASTLYLGGGTPSILSLKQIDRLFSIIRSAITFAEHAEVTVEANPDSLTSDVLALLKEQGVNRLSVGVQSFSDAILDWLKRPHTARQAREALTLCRKQGFDNINIDLIYGIPGLQRKTWTDTLTNAIEHHPEHLAAYSLSLDEDSMLLREHEMGVVQLPEDDLVVQQYEEGIAALESSDYQHYEISNFCLPSRECLHNLNYWQRGEYLGLGPAAWTFLDGKRSMNVADLSTYLSRINADGNAIEFEETPTPKEAFSESLALGLRLTSGVDLRQFSLHYGSLAVEPVIDRIRHLRETGYYHLDGQRLRLTKRGRLLSNDAIARILS